MTFLFNVFVAAHVVQAGKGQFAQKMWMNVIAIPARMVPPALSLPFLEYLNASVPHSSLVTCVSSRLIHVPSTTTHAVIFPLALHKATGQLSASASQVRKIMHVQIS